MSTLSVKLLNGDLVQLEFLEPVVTLFQVWHAIWECDLTHINSLILHTPDLERKIVVKQYNERYDWWNKSEDFVRDKYPTEGCARKVDLSVFSECQAMCNPEGKENRTILVYVENGGKARKVMCLDVNDPSWKVRPASHLNTRDPTSLSETTAVRYIDVSSFVKAFPLDTFRAGPNMFESTIENIERYLSRIIPGFQPSYMVKVSRTHLDSAPLIQRLERIEKKVVQ